MSEENVISLDPWNSKNNLFEIKFKIRARNDKMDILISNSFNKR